MAAAISTIDRSDGSSSSDGEELFDDPPTDNSDIRLELRTSGQDAARHFTSEKVYQMPADRHGHCLIISNYQFKSGAFIDGSQMDTINLKAVFEKLRFDVSIMENLNSHEFVGVLDEELSHPDHVKLGMFVLILMSHGGPGNVVFGTDDKPVQLHAMFKRIYTCKALLRKPKFIIINAYAGVDFAKYSKEAAALTSDNSVIASDIVPSKENLELSAPPENVLLLKSSFDGFASVRSHGNGSPFIRVLVEALYKHSNNVDLEALCSMVQKKMLMARVSPIPVYTTFLFEKVFLFPGISSRDLRDESHSGPILDESRIIADVAELIKSMEIGKRYTTSVLGSCDARIKSLYKSPKVYLMSKEIRGRCLIINNKIFSENGKVVDVREGSDIDVTNLVYAFSQLKFHVTVKQDVEGHKLADEVESEVSCEDNQTYGMFVLVIMTHGDSGVLYGSDMKPVLRYLVLQKLYESSFLKSKPKLIIINACQGDFETRYDSECIATQLAGDYQQLEYDMVKPSKKEAAPSLDAVLMTSTCDGYVSVRDPSFGSPFIRAFTEVLVKHAHCMHIMKIYNLVARCIVKAGYPVPGIYPLLFGIKLYLFPNYDGE